MSRFLLIDRNEIRPSLFTLANAIGFFLLLVLVAVKLEELE